MKIIIYSLAFFISFTAFSAHFDNIKLTVINNTGKDIKLYRAGFKGKNNPDYQFTYPKTRNHIYPFTKPGDEVLNIPTGKKIVKTNYSTDRFNQALTYSNIKYTYANNTIFPHVQPNWIFTLYHNFNDIITGSTTASVAHSLAATSPIIINTVKMNKDYLVILQKDKIVSTVLKVKKEKVTKK
jgi:hypothetical protein